MPAPAKASVSAGPDKRVCVGDSVSLYSQGGTSYKWKLVNPAADEDVANDYLSDPNIPNPGFRPQRSGEYIYEMKAYNADGCFARDTVVYRAEDNKLKLTINPEWTMVDSGAVVRFDVKGSLPADVAQRLKPLKFLVNANISPFLDASKREEITNNDSVSQYILFSHPVYQPISAKFSLRDAVCKTEKDVSIRVKGLKISGKITNFPFVRCGNDREEKTMNLKLALNGGSNRFTYQWHVTDLEFKNNPALAARIENAQSGEDAKLFYYGRCAVTVDIHDTETGEDLRLSDTMGQDVWRTATAHVSIDSAEYIRMRWEFDRPFCTGRYVDLQVNCTQTGKNPTYKWYKNGVLLAEWANKTRIYTNMNRGDSVQCVLYSTENCLTNKNGVVVSAPFAPDIRNAGAPSITICHTAENTNICDKVEVLATCRMLGKKFRLQFLRNNQVILDTSIVHFNPDLCEVRVSLPRKGGYYDGIQCRAIKSDFPCELFTTIYATTCTSVPAGKTLYLGSKAISANIESAGGIPKITGVSMPEKVACRGSKFSLTAQIENMSKDFELRWYRKKGKDSALLGFYSTSWDNAWDNKKINVLGFGEVDYVRYCLNGGENGENAKDLVYADPSGKTTVFNKNATVFQDGYKITLNDPNTTFVCPAVRQNFTAKDTVYFVLVSKFVEKCDASSGVKTYVMRSPYFSPEMEDPKPLPALTLDYLEKSKICYGLDHSFHLVGSLPGEKHYNLEWKFERYYSVTDSVSVVNTMGDMRQWFKLFGKHNDTLESKVAYWSNSNIADLNAYTCTATVTGGCNMGKVQTKVIDLKGYVVNKSFFYIKHNWDTVVCADKPVKLWAGIIDYSKFFTDQFGGFPLEKDYKFYWANSLKDLQADKYLHSGETYTVNPTPNNNQPKGTGDIDDIRGRFKYYVKVKESFTGCTTMDSIEVFIGHPYKVEASIDYMYPGKGAEQAWCDSADYIKVDYKRKVEDLLYRPGGQYAIVHTKNAGSEPFIEWYVNDQKESFSQGTSYDTVDLGWCPDNDTIKAWITPSSYTCLGERVEAKPLIVHVARKGDLEADGPLQAAAGEKIILQSAVLNHEDPALGLGGYDYTYGLKQPDGSWKNLGRGGSNREEDHIDSIAVQMPNQQATFRVTSRDKYGVCPIQSKDIDVALNVDANIYIKMFDPITHREIEGLCPQSYDFVYADGKPAPGGVVRFVNTTRKPMDVLVRAYTQNPGREAYVEYFKNDQPYAVGPVGVADKLPFNPSESEFNYDTVLKRGDSVVIPVLPGDFIEAYYTHDTICAEGESFLSTPRYFFNTINTAGKFMVDATPRVLCNEGTTSLSAAFEKVSVASVVWSAASGFTSTENPATASLKGRIMYSATARDSKGCAWTDSILVGERAQGEILSLDIESDDVKFCGKKIMTKIRLNRKRLSPGDFEKFDWYVVEPTGNRLIESNTTGILQMEVTNGMRVMAQAKLKIACQSGVLQSNVLQFTGYDYPSLKRRTPLYDTAICRYSRFVAQYDVSNNALVQWFDLWGNDPQKVIKENSNQFVIESMEKSWRLRIMARNAGFPTCSVSDTLRLISMSSYAKTPSVKIVSDKKEVCGEEKVIYTATTQNADQLIWVINNQAQVASSKVLERVPRAIDAAGALDTVYALAVRHRYVSGETCIIPDTVKSAVKVVLRVDKPELHLLTHDTVVNIGNPVELRAEASARIGSTPIIEWYDAADDRIGIGSPFTVNHDKQGDYLYYGLAYQTEYVDMTSECYSYDSLTIVVEDPSAPPQVSLTHNRNEVCGEQEITYTATTRNADFVIWVANGEVLNHSDKVLKRVPRTTGYNAPEDSVYVMALRYRSEENRMDTAKSQVMLSWRYDKPILHMLSRDTTVEEGSTVILRAEATVFDGPEAILWWYDENADEWYKGKTHEITDAKRGKYLYYATASQAEVEQALEECFSYDSLTVTVKAPVKPEVSLTYDREVVCGEQEITYTVTTQNIDRIIWVVNSEVLDHTGNVLKRVPRLTGFDHPEDSVYVLGLCIQKDRTDTIKSVLAQSLRADKPDLKLLTRDTTVFKGNPVILRAEATVFDGPEVVVAWYKVKGEELHNGKIYETTHSQKGDYRYYVTAFQTDVLESLPECYSLDSLTVHVIESVGTEGGEEADLIITPNPSTGRFTIQTKGDSRIEIISSTGDLVWFEEHVKGKKMIELNQTGIFFVKATTPQGIVIKKLVIR